MIKKSVVSIVVALTSVLSIASFTQAHKINVFAYESGGTITTEVKFSGGRPAKNTTVVVENPSGAELLSGTTDENGLFHFPIPQEAREMEMDLTIVADVGEGHRGTWLLEAGDYLLKTSEEHAHTAAQPQPLRPRSQDLEKAESLEYRALEKIVEKALQKELAPIKRMLAQESEKKPDLRDVLGGLGYIFGLAGIAAYFKSKKTKN
jgi:nickel transport protein